MISLWISNKKQTNASLHLIWRIFSDMQAVLTQYFCIAVCLFASIYCTMACGSVKQALHRADNHLENGVLDKFLGLKKAQMANVSRFTVHKVQCTVLWRNFQISYGPCVLISCVELFNVAFVT